MNVDLRNSEKYLDLTAHDAIVRIEQTERAECYRPVVYICSPYSGDVEGNTEKARRYSRFAVDRGVVPIAPHLLFPQFMDEGTERDLAMFMDLVLLTKCAELWVFGQKTQGMAIEVGKAKRRRMKIRYFSENCEEVTR